MTSPFSEKNYLTAYGFVWGPLEVVKLAQIPGVGAVLELKTPRERIEVRVTPTGLIRLGEIEKVKK